MKPPRISEIEITATRARTPEGKENVNKIVERGTCTCVSTSATSALPGPEGAPAESCATARITQDGVVVIKGAGTRDAPLNRPGATPAAGRSTAVATPPRRHFPTKRPSPPTSGGSKPEPAPGRSKAARGRCSRPAAPARARQSDPDGAQVRRTVYTCSRVRRHRARVARPVPPSMQRLETRWTKGVAEPGRRPPGSTASVARQGGAGGMADRGEIDVEAHADRHRGNDRVLRRRHRRGRRGPDRRRPRDQQSTLLLQALDALSRRGD